MRELRERMENLLADINASIQYTPHRENDLVALMRQYIKEEPAVRPRVLENLRRCMDGEPYPCPYVYSYTQEHSDQARRLLETYLAAADSSAGDKAAIRRCGERLEEQLNALDDRCGGWLLDAWRREQLAALIRETEELFLDVPAWESPQRMC